MTTSGLASPPRAAPRVPANAPKPPAPLRATPQARVSFERVLGWSLFVSLLAHVLFLLLSPLLIQMETPPGAASQASTEAVERFGMQMIIAVPSETAPDEPPLPEIEPTTPPVFQAPPQTATPPATPAEVPPGPAAPPAGPQPSPGTGGALQPGYRDPRLYVPPRPLPNAAAPRTEHERYMDHIQTRIDALNDSMAVAANRERRTSDWTITDGSGNRWGVSPDGLHLGGVTVPRALLPLPAPTGDNASIEGERERQRQRDEIIRQEEARDRAETQRERNEANQRP